MLSTIYQAAKSFEKEHGISPNLLYMNYAHLECLKLQLDDPYDFNSILVFLGMELILQDQSVSPSVSWSKTPWKEAIHV